MPFSASIEINRHFDVDRLKAGIVEKTEQFARDLLEASRPRVPVLTGKLAASGHLAETEVTDTGVSTQVVYGDDEVDYAVYVHEFLADKHPHGGEPKFLETPAKQMQPEFPPLIADATRKGLTGE